MERYSLYIHIPFCASRCGYCDFNTYAGQESLIPAYTTAVCEEIGYLSKKLAERQPIHTIFFGGGTPSLLPLQDLQQVMQAINDGFDLEPSTEVTLEANPGTVSKNYLNGLRSLGFNRLSLGVQSAHPDELKVLERLHDYPTVIRSVTWARQAGFDNLNLDLMFGLPGQHMENWERTLKLVMGLHPEHLSLYALSIEHGTPFGFWAKRGLLTIPDPDLAADLYEMASDLLGENDYAQYEISNWAYDLSFSQQISDVNPYYACRHNLQYWRNLPYLGIGAGAHGYYAGKRTANVLTPSDYIRRLSEMPEPDLTFPATPATHTVQPIDQETEIGETMMTGLRLVREGVSERPFQQRFNRSLEELFAVQISRFTKIGLLEWVDDEGDRRLRLTQKGRLLGNQVFAEFI